MAKALVATWRTPESRISTEHMRAVCARMAPDNLTPSEPYVFESQGAITCVFNPPKKCMTRGGSVCLGSPIFGSQEEGAPSLNVGGPIPEGTFALFRVNDDNIEACTDYAATRSIWYYQSDELFVASTSQRMLIGAISSFVPNPKAVGWSLASGTLGPGLSWDSRVRYLRQNSRLLFDRRAWAISVDHGSPLDIEEVPQSFNEARERLNHEVQRSCEGLRIDARDWVLALSGGMDSRSILYHVKGRQGLSAVTWATALSKQDPLSDARIAQDVARQSGVQHFFAMMGEDQVPFSTMLRRFVKAGEGRIDHLSGYMDGLKLWSDLSRTGKGIIRGYDAFGRKAPVRTDYQARLTCEMCFSDEALHLRLPREYSITSEDLPSTFARRSYESLEGWRDRLWLQFRTPFVTAALDELKVAYVEISNPLLSRGVVDVARSLPVAFRESKNLFASIVKAQYPQIPFAKAIAVHNLYEIVGTDAVKEFVNDELRSSDVPFPNEVRNALLKGLEVGRSSERIRRRAIFLAKRMLPLRLENMLRTKVPVSKVSNRRLAVRALIAKQAHDVLREDAKVRATSSPIEVRSSGGHAAAEGA